MHLPFTTDSATRLAALMHDSIAALAEGFRVSTNLYLKALHGLGPDVLVTRINGTANPIIWLAGHLVQFRSRLAQVIGAPPREIGWANLFITGSRPGDPAHYPPLDEIVAMWREVSADIEARFEELTGDELMALPPVRVATPDGTMRAAIALFAFHDAYHIGQIGLIRRTLGYPPLIDS